MKNAKQYYIWMYLPDSLRLPKYLRNKERRKEISEKILQSIKRGEAKLFQSGLGSPTGTIRKTFDQNKNLGLFTNVILKFSTHKNIAFDAEEHTLLAIFLNIFQKSRLVTITGDNTRLDLNTDKYRQVILEGVES